MNETAPYHPSLSSGCSIKMSITVLIKMSNCHSQALHNGNNNVYPVLLIRHCRRPNLYNGNSKVYPVLLIRHCRRPNKLGRLQCHIRRTQYHILGVPDRPYHFQCKAIHVCLHELMWVSSKFKVEYTTDLPAAHVNMYNKNRMSDIMIRMCCKFLRKNKWFLTKHS